MIEGSTCASVNQIPIIYSKASNKSAPFVDGRISMKRKQLDEFLTMLTASLLFEWNKTIIQILQKKSRRSKDEVWHA